MITKLHAFRFQAKRFVTMSVASQENIKKKIGTAFLTLFIVGAPAMHSLNHLNLVPVAVADIRAQQKSANLLLLFICWAYFSKTKC